MHRDIANLFFAKYGTRNSQAKCGNGSGSNTTKTGYTDALGMQDTIMPSNGGNGGNGGNGSGRRVAHRRPREGSHSNSGEGNLFPSQIGKLKNHGQGQ